MFNNNHFNLLIFCAVFSSSAVIGNAQQLDACTTPDDQSQGTCINIRQCQPMLDYLENTQLTPEIRALLQKYQCGFEGKNPKVCCPQRTVLILDQSPNVEGHQNLKLLPNDCGHVDTGERIIGGNKTGLFEFPWMALLSYRTDRGPDFRCGGTIINNRYILTAAHCIANLRFPLLGVRVGEHDIRTKIDCEKQEDGEEVCAPAYKDLAIEQTIPHPQYDSKSFSNDIGLLRVSRIRLNNENIRPICLPLEDARTYNFSTRNVIVTGWGVSDLQTGRSSPDLLKVEIPFVPLPECKSAYEQIRNVKIGETQICAGGKDRKDSCGGDSGGPLQVVTYLHNDNRYVQQGIVSFGPRDCGREKNPGVYTKVSAYMDWILDTIRS